MSAIREPFRVALLCALLAAATFALFRPAIHFDFLDYDDPDFVTANPHVLGGVSWQNIRWAFTSPGNAGNWQPLTWLSLMLDADCYGASPGGFHLTNIAWHAVNAALAFLLLRELTGATLLSYAAAAWFAWQPLRVESVAWIAERKDVMSVGFGLLALWAFSRDLKGRDALKLRQRPWYFVALGAYVLGLLCKPMLVTLPFVFLMLRLAWRAREAPGARAAAGASVQPTTVHRAWRPCRRDAFELLPFAVPALACATIAYRVQHAVGAVSDQFTSGHRVANALVAIVHYLADIVWPARLSVAYPHDRHLGAAPAVLCLILLVATTTLVLRIRTRRSWIAAGWMWFLVMLVPVLGLVQVGAQARADRYTYLPSLGLSLALVCLVAGLARSKARSLGVALLATTMLGFAAVRTRQQLPIWRNSTTLFEHAVQLDPDNYIARSARATTLFNSGDRAGAARQVDRALRTCADYVPALLVRAVLDETEGQMDQAEARCRAALSLAPRYAPVHERLGSILLHQGRYGDALAEFDAAIADRAEAPAAELGRALALMHLHRAAAAEASFARAIALRPDYPEAHRAYAYFLDDRGDVERAWSHYGAAVRLRPRYGLAHFEYARSLLAHDQAARAVDQYRAAVSLEPDDEDARRGLALAVVLAGPADGLTAQRPASASSTPW